jgi:hypothetical protein
LVREQKARSKKAASPPRRRSGAKPAAPAGQAAEAPPSPVGESRGEGKEQEALDLVLETVEALMDEREGEIVWGSMVKQALKRRKPGFNESYYGFRSFNGLLEEAQSRGLLDLERDEKSGGYIVRATPE